MPKAVVMTGIFIFLSFYSNGFAASAHAPETGKPGWEFVLQHEDGVRHRVGVWHDGLRIDDGTVSTIYRADAIPEIVILSEENRTYAAMSLSKLLAVSLLPPMVSPDQKYFTRLEKRTKQSGVTIQYYAGCDLNTKKTIFKLGVVSGIASTKVDNAACAIGLLPQLAGVPVYAERLVKGKMVPFLLLVSAERKSIDLRALNLSRNYQRVSTPLELIFRRGSKPMDQGDLDDIFMSKPKNPAQPASRFSSDKYP